FVGPMLGAVIGVLLTKLLPDYTAGWQMYLGIVFILVVVYAPRRYQQSHQARSGSAQENRHPQTLRLVRPAGSERVVLAGGNHTRDRAAVSPGCRRVRPLVNVGSDPGPPLGHYVDRRACNIAGGHAHH